MTTSDPFWFVGNNLAGNFFGNEDSQRNTHLLGEI